MKESLNGIKKLLENLTQPHTQQTLNEDHKQMNKVGRNESANSIEQKSKKYAGRKERRIKHWPKEAENKTEYLNRKYTNKTYGYDGKNRSNRKISEFNSESNMQDSPTLDSSSEKSTTCEANCNLNEPGEPRGRCDNETFVLGKMQNEEGIPKTFLSAPKLDSSHEARKNSISS